ncbi:MAG: tRNA glutamyl-Q(34) synthetase GluQRS [Kiritimatiellae bacterium]|jgi:glutamyl-tRNA synthetase|nr:tRNA glutamyl-Q(34) synthetase GluQRS [Kiritimatiellia bacterium]
MKNTPLKLRGRLAPSPTGALHLGNIRTFMITCLLARSRGGELVMRIEDLDHPKNKPGAVVGMIDDLRWLGFDWDEGYGSGGNDEEYIQSRRIELYAEALEKLKAQNLIYPCTCSRKDVEAGLSAPHSDECLLYSGTCRTKYLDFASAQAVLPDGRIPAWRFKVPEGESISFIDSFCGKYSQIPSDVSGDFVLARHEFGAGYMLAVVVDDALMGINQIVRGDDLLSATPRQILIYRALGLELPEYIHLPLVVGPDGRRLAKRHGDTRVSFFREAGVSPEKIIGALAASCGWAEENEELSLSDLLLRFDMSLLPHEPFVWHDDPFAS